ncbi:hypothetical protein ABT026_28230 [Streptomyces sp. NPDC002734]|uniref:hypothetical protein n=1 Tax=Streptomyces sp. NPDC002734 TaxID=3154426 RepID=UPI0033290EE9
MFTGKTLIDGVWTVRKDCMARSRHLGARCLESFSRSVTLVVHGELAGNVKDADRGLSQKLLRVIQERKSGQHVHVVDAAGFSDLLFEAPAKCRDLQMQGPHVAVMPEVGDGILGGPFERIEQRKRGLGQSGYRAFGYGSERHKKLLTDLVRLKRGRPSIQLRHPARRGPQFDIGWIDGQTPYGAWVAAPEPADSEVVTRRLEEATLQISRTIRSTRSRTELRPVVVLENTTRLDPRLRRTADDAGVVLSRLQDLPR